MKTTNLTQVSGPVVEQVRQLAFVVAVNNRTVLEQNLLASPVFAGQHAYEILQQERFCSAAKAYNDALDRSHNDLVIFVHQDIFLPSGWIESLERAINYLEQHDPNWGVLGCFGTTQSGARYGHVFSNGLGVLGSPLEHPTPVQTLDEIVLILRRSSGLRFDEDLPSYHFYGTDVCMSAAQRGLTNYAIDAYCVHNTNELRVLPRDFYLCYRYMKRRWRNCLPIQTSCIRMTNFDLPLYKMRLQETLTRIRRRHRGVARSNDPSQFVVPSYSHHE